MRMPRFEIASPIDWCVDGKLTHFRSITRNVSEGGLLVRTMDPAPIGAAVALSLDAGRIRLRGKVARVDESGFAVALDDEDGLGRRRLRWQMCEAW